jgi:hypothetical protein
MNSKKTKQLLGFKKPKKNPPEQESLVFLEKTVHGWGRQQKTNENPGRNPR